MNTKWLTALLIVWGAQAQAMVFSDAQEPDAKTSQEIEAAKKAMEHQVMHHKEDEQDTHKKKQPKKGDEEGKIKPKVKVSMQESLQVQHEMAVHKMDATEAANTVAAQLDVSAKERALKSRSRANNTMKTLSKETQTKLNMMEEPKSKAIKKIGVQTMPANVKTEQVSVPKVEANADNSIQDMDWQELEDEIKAMDEAP
jgi:hypothetical protein